VARVGRMKFPLDGGEVGGPTSELDQTVLECWPEHGDLASGGERELGRGLLEPGLRVRVERLAFGNEARQGRKATSTIVATQEEPVFSSYGKWFDRGLDQIVLQRQCAVGDIDVECVPLIAGVGDSLVLGTLGQRDDGELIDPRLQSCE
jgi:hypothetical protein